MPRAIQDRFEEVIPNRMPGMLGSPRRLLLFTAIQSIAVWWTLLALLLPEAIRPHVEEYMAGRPLPKLTELCLPISSVVTLLVSHSPSVAFMVGVAHFHGVLRLLYPDLRSKTWLTVYSAGWGFLFFGLLLAFVGMTIPFVEIIQSLEPRIDPHPRLTLFLRIFSWTIVALLTLASLRRLFLTARNGEE